MCLEVPHAVLPLAVPVAVLQLEVARLLALALCDLLAVVGDPLDREVAAAEVPRVLGLEHPVGGRARLEGEGVEDGVFPGERAPVRLVRLEAGRALQVEVADLGEQRLFAQQVAEAQVRVGRCAAAAADLQGGRTSDGDFRPPF